MPRWHLLQLLGRPAGIAGEEVSQRLYGAKVSPTTLRRALIPRFYGHELGVEEREKILARLDRSS
jgi:hypothetical protein